MKKTFLLIAGLLMFAATNATFAQSTDRDRPTPMNSYEVSGNFRDPDVGAKEYFYSFTAGPGELTLTVDLKGRDQDASGSMAYELLKGNGSEAGPLLCCEFAQMGGGATGRSVASVKLTRRQTVVLHLTNSIYRGGSFNVRFSGPAVSSFGKGSGGGPGKVIDSGGDSRNGESVIVPSSGTLHIRMKDGSTKDVDLSRIRSISVRQ